MSVCWPLQMPPTAKAVLICMADFADDSGQCWPSIDTIAARTCFGRTAVISAIRWLESSGAVRADRSNGRHTSYILTPDHFNQSASRTGTPAEPVRLPDSTSTGGEPYQSASRTQPVREADSNRKEPSTTVKATTKRVVAIELPEWLPRETWNDWADHRKKIKSAMTPRAAELSIEKLAEYREQGFSPGRVINNALERGWRGLFTSGLTPDLKQPTQSKPGASGDFRGKSYTGTAIDDLPPDLRDAARAALADG